MPLPPGTLSALKDQHDSIVIVVVASLAFGAMAFGAGPWPVVAALAVVLVAFHIRRTGAERHQAEMAHHRVADAAIRVEATKARYRALYSVGEPELDLEMPPRRTAGSGPGAEGAER